MQPQIIESADAPKAIGPYSQAVKVGNLIFLSGQLPLLPESGQLLEGGIEEQTSRVLRNLEAVLRSAGGSLNDVVKTTVYLADLANFKDMNKVYEQFFGKTKPARATIEVSRLPLGALIEIEGVALLASMSLLDDK